MVETINYTDAVRTFAFYFVSKYAKDLTQINARSFSNGYFRNENNIKMFKFLADKIGLNNENNLELKNFLTWTLALYNDYSNDAENYSNLHLNKDNNSIVIFLQLIIDFKGVISDCDPLDNTQKDQLTLIHYKFMSKFANNGNHVETYLNNHVDSHLNSRFDNSNISINNVSSNSNSTQNRLQNVINNNKMDFKFIRKKLNKHLRYDNHIQIYKIHKDRKTTPKSVFFERFPRPFFEDDKEFIDKYNNLVLNFQDDTMNLIKDTLESRKSKIIDDINEFKEEFKTMPKYSEFKENFDDLKKIIFESEENQLLDTFVRNKQRAERCIVKKFEVKDSEVNSTVNSSASSNSNISNNSNKTNGSFTSNFKRRNIRWDHSVNQNYSNNNINGLSSMANSNFNNFGNLNNQTNNNNRSNHINIQTSNATRFNNNNNSNYNNSNNHFNNASFNNCSQFNNNFNNHNSRMNNPNFINNNNNNRFNDNFSQYNSNNNNNNNNNFNSNNRNYNTNNRNFNNLNSHNNSGFQNRRHRDPYN